MERVRKRLFGEMRSEEQEKSEGLLGREGQLISQWKLSLNSVPCASIPRLCGCRMHPGVDVRGLRYLTGFIC